MSKRSLTKLFQKRLDRDEKKQERVMAQVKKRPADHTDIHGPARKLLRK